jgi:hypothetical protein
MENMNFWLLTKARGLYSDYNQGIIRYSESHTLLMVQMNIVFTFYTFLPLWIKFGADFVALSSVSNCKFRKNQYKKSRRSVKALCI